MSRQRLAASHYQRRRPRGRKGKRKKKVEKEKINKTILKSKEIILNCHISICRPAGVHFSTDQQNLTG